MRSASCQATTQRWVEQVLAAAGLAGDAAPRSGARRPARHHHAHPRPDRAARRSLRRCRTGRHRRRPCAHRGVRSRPSAHRPARSRAPARWSPPSFARCCARCRRGSTRSRPASRAAPDEAHLLVSAVGWESHGRIRKGVASRDIADRRRVGEMLKIYVKPNPHFRLPADPDRKIIMVGPGTGVAPFRGFLQGSRGRPGRAARAGCSSAVATSPMTSSTSSNGRTG